ncbi:MAG: hypothetical protein AAGB48_02290 [Planctomycetota bacterium]
MCIAAAGIAGPAVFAPVHVQAQSPADSRADTAQQPGSIELAATAFELPSLGMRFRLPVGATATSRRLGSATHADIVGPDSRYRIAVSSRTSANTSLTAQAAAEAVLLNLKEAFAVTDGDADRPSRVPLATFARQLRTVEPVGFLGGEAYRFFILQPATRSEGETVRGVALIDLGEGRMLVWDSTAPSEGFDELAGVLDGMLATVTFDSAEARYEQRGVAVKEGEQLLAGLASEQLRSVIDAYGERWARLYAPSGGGEDEEIGYRRVSASLGSRRDMTAGGSSTASESPGYIVRLEARTLERQGSNQPLVIYDSRGTYWVSEDFSEEAWEITIAIKRDGRTSTFSSVGARDGFEQLLVTTQSPNGRSETVQLAIQREGYLPTALALLLPDILALAETPGEFAFYAYRPDATSVSYRRDIFQKSDNSRGWTLRSTVTPGAPELVRELNPSGALIREQLPDGKVWEPIDLRSLASLWRRKGLPLD